MQSLFLGIDCTNLIQTGRNQKFILILYDKSVVKFFITVLVSEIS